MSGEKPSVVLPTVGSSDASGLTHFIDEGRAGAVSTYQKAIVKKDTLLARYNRFCSTGSAHFSASMSTFHEKRRAHPWTLIGGSAIATTVLTLPFGRSTAVRAGVFGGLVALCVVNPEYIYDTYYNYIAPKYKK